MNVSKYLLIISLVLSASFAVAQKEEEELKPAELKKAAANFLRQGDTYSALDYYEMYCDKRPYDHRAFYKLAELYRVTRDYVKAEKAFRAILDNTSGNQLMLFQYARLLKMNGKYREAEKQLEEFLAYKGSFKDAKKYRKLAEAELEGCRLYEKLRLQPPLYNVYHLDSSINKAYSESSPAFAHDSTFVFSTIRADTVLYREDGEKLPLKKFYVAYKEKGTWMFHDILNQPYNHSRLHSSNGAYAPSGKRFYFTCCDAGGDNAILCDIYVSELIQDKWSEPRKIEELEMSGYTSTQPTVQEDSLHNETLYFSSDRPGGKGGKDIWYSIHNTRRGTYSRPQNAGSINTPGDEITPWYDNRNGLLYFSSDGWPGIGGSDIFRSRGSLKTWDAPGHMGMPVNSGADDMYYILNRKQTEGLLVSNRYGSVALRSPTCCDDLYGFAEKSAVQLVIAGRITESSDSVNYLAVNRPGLRPVGSAKVSLYRLNEKNEEVLQESRQSNDSGYYSFNAVPGERYKVTVEKREYFSRSVYVNMEKTRDTHVPLTRISGKPFVISDIYYPFDESYLTEASMATIDTTIYRLLVENPSIIIELSSHTDSKGDDEYNLRLSQGRAESVVEYLVKKGIDKRRLRAKGYGETIPIAANTGADGTDNPAGREMNRRTEFRVIGIIGQ